MCLLKDNKVLPVCMWKLWHYYYVKFLTLFHKIAASVSSLIY